MIDKKSAATVSKYAKMVEKLAKEYETVGKRVAQADGLFFSFAGYVSGVNAVHVALTRIAENPGDKRRANAHINAEKKRDESERIFLRFAEGVDASIERLKEAPAKKVVAKKAAKPAK